MSGYLFGEWLFLDLGWDHLDLWLGSVGAHLYWPDVWHSCFDRCSGWRDDPVDLRTEEP